MKGALVEWQRLLSKLLVLGLIVFSVVFFLNRLYIRTNWYLDYESGLQEIKKFQSVPGNLDIINLGSSPGWFALSYDNLQFRGFNMGLSVQDFFYDYSLLRKYFHHLKPGCIVLICLSYHSFFVTSEAVYQQSQFNEQKYYLFLEPQYINHFKASKWIQYKMFPVILAREHLLDIFHNGFKRQDPLDINKNIIGPDFAKFAGLEGELIKKYASHLQTGIPLNRIRLRKIIFFCKQNHLKPVLIVTPYPKALNRSLGEKFIQQNFRRFIKPWQQAHIPYFDYSQDSKFSNSPDLFLDPQHLNKRGREIFTETVIKDLQQNRIMPKFESKLGELP
jgi:hypothetical protein